MFPPEFPGLHIQNSADPLLQLKKTIQKAAKVKQNLLPYEERKKESSGNVEV